MSDDRVILLDRKPPTTRGATNRLRRADLVGYRDGGDIVILKNRDGGTGRVDQAGWNRLARLCR